MAVVYEAVSPFGVSVVLKMLHPDLVGQDEVVERFRREGRIQFTLRHPNIVRVTDMVEHDGLPALVADYMEGVDLEKAILDGHRFDFPDTLKIVTKMLDALHTAHQSGFIHRDIKPSNIFLEATDYGFEPRLMDFGIAKIEAAAALTRAQEFCGTPAYTSPEQIQSTKDVDPRTDVYSMGVVLWQLLSGEEPYGDLAADPYKVLVAVVRETLPSLPASIPGWLEQIVARATEKDPSKRFSDAAQFRDALLEGADATDDLAQTMVIPDPSGGHNFVAPATPMPAQDSLSQITRDIDSKESSAPAQEQSPLDSLSPLDVSQSSFEDGAAVVRRPDAHLGSSEALDPASAPGETPASVPRRDPEHDPQIDIHELTRQIEEEEGPRAARPEQPPADLLERAPVRHQTVSRRPLTAPMRAQKKQSSAGAVVMAAAALVIVGCMGLAGYSLWNRPQAAPAGFARIEAGTFLMGSPEGEVGRGTYEDQVRVTITRPYAIMRTEVTRAEWIELMVSQPNAFPECGDSCPVAAVSWLDAAEFANRRSIAEGLEPCYEIARGAADREVIWPKGWECLGYRLPTEAEWEFAARGGSEEALPTGGLRNLQRELIDPNLHELGYYAANSHADYRGAATCSNWSPDHDTCGIQPVREKAPNGYGLHDMHGNVAEWTWGFYGPYPEGPLTDPTGQDWGTQRVVRGGSWMDTADECRAASRASVAPIGRRHVGFRLVRTLRR